MNCKIIINAKSGNCKRVNVEKLLEIFGKNSDVQFVGKNTYWDDKDCDVIVVCGGDGTLKNALNNCKHSQIVYVPCGTFNEISKQKDVSFVGKVNDQLFGYVCATGSFTPIGYETPTKSKKKLKIVAYLLQVLKHYKCHQIAATVNVDGKTFYDNYTLLMVIKGRRCFGFNFNKCCGNKLCLLAIKSFGKNNVTNKIKMFFPFFRVFFFGIHNPTIAQNWMFLPFDKATISLQNCQDFCVDGEKLAHCKTLTFSNYKLTKPIKVLNLHYLRHYHVHCQKRLETYLTANVATVPSHQQTI